MKQKISECMDGELDAIEAGQILAQLADSAELRAHWVVYHMIGDGMRDARSLSADFAERVAGRLAAEPTVLAPKPLVRQRARMANYALYAAASVAAIGVVGWVAFSPQMAPTQQQIAGQPAQVAVAAKSPRRPELSPLNERDHDYLLAHQAVSPSGMMPGVAPYVRTVSFGTEANGR